METKEFWRDIYSTPPTIGEKIIVMCSTSFVSTAEFDGERFVRRMGNSITELINVTKWIPFPIKLSKAAQEADVPDLSYDCLLANYKAALSENLQIKESLKKATNRYMTAESTLAVLEEEKQMLKRVPKLIKRIENHMREEERRMECLREQIEKFKSATGTDDEEEQL